MIVFDSSKFFRRQWRFSPKLSYTGKPIGAFVSSVLFIEKLCNAFGRENILVLFQEYSPVLKTEKSNRFYELTEEEEINYYVWQKALLAEVALAAGINISENYSFLSREVVYYLYQINKNIVIYTSDRELLFLIEREKINYLGGYQTEQYRKKSFIQLSFDGLPFFLNGVTGIRRKKNGRDIFNFDEIKDDPDELEEYINALAINNSTKKKILSQLGRVRVNYKRLTSSFLDISYEDLLERRSVNVMDVKKVLQEEGLEEYTKGLFYVCSKGK